MTFRNDETIQCVRCGRHFTWSYGEQRYYHEHNLHRPKRCPQCREIVRGEQRSSQIDHEVPPIFVQPKPDRKPTQMPLRGKRPSWWADPLNRNTLLLLLLISLFIVIILILLATIF